MDDLDAVITAIEGLSTDTRERSDMDLADRMRRLVAARAMLDAVLVEHVGAFDARGAAGYDGQTSTRAWLRSRLRLGGQAGQLLATARQVSQLPQLAKALAAGEITLEQASVVAELARQVEAEKLMGYEPIIVGLARQAPPAQVQAACNHLRQLLDAAGAEHDASRRRRARQLSAARTLDGLVHLQGLLDPGSGEVVLAALSAAMPAPAQHEERTPAQRRADALADICGQWLACDHAPTTGGYRPQVQVTISLDRLRTQATGAIATAPAAGKGARSTRAFPGDAAVSRATWQASKSTAEAAVGWTTRSAGVPAKSGSTPPGLIVGDVPITTDHAPIPAGEARRIACDAGIIPIVLGSGSEPLDVGRRSRLVPTGMRRALQLRDGGCRFPGCDRPPTWCEAHHIWHWANGGQTTLDNMILLCRHHHGIMHEGWQLHGHPSSTIHFTRPDHTRLDLTSQPRGQPVTSPGP